MNGDLKLTCLMPLYNMGTTLSKSIESVLMQKTDFNFRLLIIDDKSTDRSLEIAKEYQTKYPDIIEIVENEKNLNLLHTSVKGYERIKTDYMCVLDPDDWYTVDDKFQRAIDFLETHQVFTAVITNIVIKTKEKEEPMHPETLESFDFDFDDMKNGKAVFVQTSGAIFRNVVFKNGLPEAFKNGLKSKYNQAFRADVFRHIAHLYVGKFHFENRFESVYNYTGMGVWSQYTLYEQHLYQVTHLLPFFEYFHRKEPYFLKLSVKYMQESLRVFFEQLFTVDCNLKKKYLDDFFEIYQDLNVLAKKYNMNLSSFLEENTRGDST